LIIHSGQHLLFFTF